jgi:hypothetical protein
VKYDKSNTWEKRKWWYLLLSPLIIAGAAVVSVCIPSFYQIFSGPSLKTLLANVAFVVSRGAMFGFAVFLLISLGKTLRRRWLTIEELVIYVAATGITLALPKSVYEVHYRWGDLIDDYYQVNWLALYMAAVSLALIAFLIRRSGRH